MDRNNKLLASTVEAIGSTPLVELGRITKDVDGRILAKLEFLNPGFSKKDRVARQIILEAEEQGELRAGQTVVELTSGNTGTGLAIVCGVRGYPFVAVMSRGNTEERARMMRALGAEVVLVDQLPDSKHGQVSGGDLELVEKKTKEITRERKAFRADQFVLRGNFRAHYLNTGREIIEQTDGCFDVFCDFVGTGGSFGGCTARFKEFNSEIRCFIIEPASAPALSGLAVENPNHKIQGGGYSIPDLNFVDKALCDGFVTVRDEEAILGARRLASEEGLFAGFSAGANVAAALKLLRGEHKGSTVVVLINDSGLKYLSTDLWDG
jgi:cysteine synthase A